MVKQISALVVIPTLKALITYFICLSFIYVLIHNVFFLYEIWRIFYVFTNNADITN